MKKTITLLTLLVGLLLTTTSLAVSSGTQPLEKIVAIANNEVITQSQLDQGLSQAKKQVAARHINISQSQLKQQVLDQLIMQSLQLQMAKRVKIAISNNDVSNAISNIAKQNHLTVAQLKQKLKKQGLSFKTFKSNLRKQILITKLQQAAVGQGITINNKDVQKFKQQLKQQINAAISYHLNAIVVPLSAGITKAKALLKALQQGQTLKVAAAKTYGAQVSLEEDDLGWRTKNQLPDIFEKVATNMKVNTYAGPVQAPNGFHILHLVGKKSSEHKALSNMQIKEIILQQKIEKKLIPWLKQLKSSAYVKIM